MTRTAGYYLKANPCCGIVYKTPRYGSINLSAQSYWTDGYKEGALMPGGHGLRHCKCGNFYLVRELVTISEGDTAEAPSPSFVKPADLPTAISQARNAEIELAARLDYWQHLNHDYRDRYRTHRDSEEADTQAAWEATNPDQRTWWQRFRKTKRVPEYVPSPDRPITYPKFEPTDPQRENMNSLLRLLSSEDLPKRYAFEIAELHRELGQFDQAALALSTIKMEDEGVAGRLLAELVQAAVTAPVRYRL